MRKPFKFKRLQSKQSFEQRCDFSNTFINLLENELKFEKKINTKSNLNYAVLKTLCEIFLLDISDFQPYERDIDKLVGIRNRIAHGENSYIFEDIHDINKYFLLLQNISDTFLNNIEKFIVEERYRKPVDEEQSDSLSNEEE